MEFTEKSRRQLNVILDFHISNNNEVIPESAGFTTADTFERNEEFLPPAVTQKPATVVKSETRPQKLMLPRLHFKPPAHAEKWNPLDIIIQSLDDQVKL